MPVLLDNDANLGALGEYLFGGFRDEHQAAGSHEMAYVKIATGIGTGIIRDGRIWQGASGTAGELGHTTLDFNDPTTCLCGNHGCLELYAGGEALLSKGRSGWPNLVDILDLIDRAKDRGSVLRKRDQRMPATRSGRRSARWSTSTARTRS